ncbi:MAG: phosphotransferase [Gammaproteobacteria bacterium]|nr:phosphotransferase [Gammaproteobacteria bacterium]
MERSPSTRQEAAAPAAGAAAEQDGRRAGLTAWTRARLRQMLPNAPELGKLEIVSGDASHRRYFRARPTAETSYIAVDAPPQKEDSRPFVEVTRLLRAASLRAPELHAADLEQGYMLLEDFGDQLYLPSLLQAQESGDFETVGRLYRAAIDSLLDLQQHVDPRELPAYDKTELTREMSLFPDWFCRRWLQVEPNAEQMEIIDGCFDFLCGAALAQTQVAVHRDYHSRNLMLPRAGADRPGILDFQDAVQGACSYDLVSLLRDCYIKWDRRRLEEWIGYYLEGARSRGIVSGVSDAQFRRDFDLMGLQRHLKVLGIFCRLTIRDHKAGFLADIPLVMEYFTEVAGEYREMEPIQSWFRRELEPRAREKLRSVN